MTAPVSVVIPVRDDASRIAPCLAALSEGAVEGLVAEVILADGGSGDDIAAVAEAVGARHLSAPPGRGPQLAAGAAAARAPWLLFLHADTVLTPGWPAAMRAHMTRRPDRAGFARLAFDSAHPMARVTAGWANLRARALALPYGDQGLLVSRALYDSVGGHPDMALMEDVALVRRIGRGRLDAMAVTVTTSAERYAREGWLARGWRNLTTLALWHLGVPTDRLVARYERWR